MGIHQAVGLLRFIAEAYKAPKSLIYRRVEGLRFRVQHLGFRVIMLATKERGNQARSSRTKLVGRTQTQRVLSTCIVECFSITETLQFGKVSPITVPRTEFGKASLARGALLFCSGSAPEADPMPRKIHLPLSHHNLNFCRFFISPNMNL